MSPLPAPAAVSPADLERLVLNAGLELVEPGPRLTFRLPGPAGVLRPVAHLVCPEEGGSRALAVIAFSEVLPYAPPTLAWASDFNRGATFGRVWLDPVRVAFEADLWVEGGVSEAHLEAFLRRFTEHALAFTAALAVARLALEPLASAPTDSRPPLLA